MDPIVVLSSPRKAFKTFLLSLAMVSISGYVAVLGINLLINGEVGLRPVIYALVGLVAVLFFGLGLVISLRRMYRQKILLEIHAGGIVLGAGFPQLGLIPWPDIEEAGTYHVYRQKFLGLRLRHPERLAGAATGFWGRILRINMRFGYPEISIAQATTVTDLDELQKAIERQRRSAG